MKGKRRLSRQDRKALKRGEKDLDIVLVGDSADPLHLGIRGQVIVPGVLRWDAKCATCGHEMLYLNSLDGTNTPAPITLFREQHAGHVPQ